MSNSAIEFRMNHAERQGLTVGNSDQVIVTIHPDADIEYLLSVLAINPIELKITKLGDGAFNYAAFYPKGIEVRHLPYETHADKLLDISKEPYKRLLQDRPAGTGFHLQLTELTEDSLKSLKANPLVMKLNQGNGFLIACPEHWQINKSEYAKNRFIADPCNIPPVIDRMMAFLDEPIPHSKKALELHKRRLTLRKNFLNWYSTKTFTPEVDEVLRGYAEEVEDELLAVEQQLLDFVSRSDSFNEQVLQRWIELMTEHLPDELVSSLRQKAMDLTTRAMTASRREIKAMPEAISALEVEPIAELLSDYSSHPGCADFVKALARPTDKIAIHPCFKCSSRPRLFRPADSPSVFTMACDKCGTELPAQFRQGDPVVVILSWNKRNPSPEPLYLLKSVLGGLFSECKADYISSWVRRVTAVCKMSRSDVLAHNIHFKTQNTRELVTRHEALGYQLDYIKVLLAQLSNSPK
jgi:hypothetical protein